MHLYEVRPRRDKRGVDLISDALPFGRRAERIRFRDQKITAPHTDGVKGGCFPQNISSNVASDRGASFARSQDFPVTL